MTAAASPSSVTIERIAPPRRVLFALGAGVLLAHLSLLSGGLSGLSLDMFIAPPEEARALMAAWNHSPVGPLIQLPATTIRVGWLGSNCSMRPAAATVPTT